MNDGSRDALDEMLAGLAEAEAAELRRRIAALSPDGRARFERTLLSGLPSGSPAPAPEAAPPSFGQERMWVLNELAPAAYNYATAVRLRGPVNPVALRSAIDAVAQRQESLRTSLYQADDGTLVSAVAGTVTVPFLLVDLSQLAAADDRDDRLGTLLRAETRRPFDLRQGPLLRTALYRLGPDDHLVLLTLHHAITDGWSNGVLAQALSDSYRDLTAGRPVSLPVPELAYHDYAAWQRRRLTGPELAELKDFWRTRLTDLPSTELPLDHPRPDTGRGLGANHSILAGPELAGRLGALRRQTGGTLFLQVLSALSVVLHGWTGRSELALGTLVSGRTRPEFDRLIGYFVNVVPIRTHIEHEQSFRTLWAATRTSATESLAHQEMPYEKLLELHRADGEGDTPIRVLCVAQQPQPTLELPGLTAEQLDLELGAAQFDLLVEVWEGDNGIRISFQYDLDLFAESTIVLFAEQLRTVLVRCADDPDLTAGQLLAAPPAAEPAPTAADGRTDSLTTLFERQADRTPDLIAVVDGALAVSYRALDRRANQLARQLRARGVTDGDRVVCALPRSAGSVLATLAVLKAGAAYVALDPAQPAERLAEIVADARPRCVLTTTALLSHCAPMDSPPRAVDDPGEPTGRFPAHRLNRPVHQESVAHLVYTSGSTGPPKGVLGTHRGAVNRIWWMRRAHPVTGAEVWAARTSPAFVDAVWETFGPLLSGVPLVVLSAEDTADPARLVDRLREHRVTRLVVVPTLLRILLDDQPDLHRRLPDLHTWVSSGEELGADLAERFHRCLPGRRLLNLYGCAEVAADATAAEVGQGGNPAKVPIGRAIDGVATRVLTPAGRPAPTLGIGELHVGGAGLALGYHGRPQETADRFGPVRGGGPGRRWFRTGDAVRRRADGDLEYLGRLDTQVQIRGHRVEPGEVERALLRHPDIRAAAVISCPDRMGAPMLAAYAVAVDEARPPRDVTGSLRRQLPAHAVPSTVDILAELPLNASGKVDRRRLRALRTAPAPTAERHSGPATGTTQAIVLDVFTELLPVTSRPGPNDDFLRLGGNSLLAARVAAVLRERLGTPVGLGDLIAAPTALALAARLDAAAARQGPPEFSAQPVHDPAARHQPFPLTDIQRAYLVGRDAELVLGQVSTHAYLELTAHALDLDRFQDALRAVIDRHPMLRAVIAADGTQRVLDSVPPYRISVQDLRGDTGPRRAARLADWREELSHQLLPADRWPLFDVRASLLPGGDTLVHVSIDALICDAHSFGLVMAELTDRYTGRRHAYPPPALTFRDYVLAAEHRRAGPGYRKAQQYWRDRLADLPEGPELPLATAPESIDRPRFVRRSGTLDRAQWSALKARAAELGLTPSGVLLAAFAETVTRWSRRPHYSLMLTVFQREPVHPDVDLIVGDFTSLSVLEVDHRTPAAFADRARTLHRLLWADLDHAPFSGVQVMREWARQRGRPPQLLTPVVFTSNLPPAAPSDAAQTEHTTLGKPGYGITQTPQVHLDHQVAEREGALVFNWDAVDDLFHPGVVDGMFESYQRLLADLVTDRAYWTDRREPPLPTTQQTVRSALTAAGAAAPRPHCLHEPVFARAAAQPEHIALVDGEIRMTYRELADRARQVANTLLRTGERENALVGIATRKGRHQVVAALGALAAGRAFLPLDPDLPDARMRHLMARGELSTVLTQRTLVDQLPRPAGVRVIAVDRAADLDPSDEPPAVRTDPADLAYVIFTSGSTGTPKGVMIDHRGAANTIDAVNRRFGVGPHDRVLAVSSLSFDLAVYDLFGLLSAGGTVVLPAQDKRRDPAHWAELIAREQVTVWNSVPALAEVLTDYAGKLAPAALSTLRLVLLSGDWIPVSLPDRLRALATEAQLMSLGGATEGSIWSVWYPIGEVDPRRPSVPYGVPMDHQSIRVLDDRLRPRPDWVADELYIGGAGVALGYWRDEEQTRFRFPCDPVTGERLYRTGDLARHLPDGNLEFLGRQDGQVKINGYRVELGEVEAAVQRLPGVRAAAVVAAGERGAARRLVAFVVAEPDSPPESAALRTGLGAVLPPYMIPAEFHRLDRIPLTGNGKVDRSALLAQLPGRQRRTGRVRGAAAPQRRGRLLAELADIWAELLSVPTVRPKDNFFALGGTSLEAIRLMTKLQQAMGVRIPMLRLFTTPTLAALADAVTEAQAGAAPTPDPGPPPELTACPDDRSEPFPLTDIQQAYWLGRRTGFGLGGVATHSYLELDVDDLDVPRLEQALRLLIDRHDALRTVVRRDGRQQVLPTVPAYRIDTADLRGRAPDAATHRLAEVRGTMSHQVRATEDWPLFELRAHRTDGTTTRLHISVDLLIADAHSTRILTRELLALYHDPEAELPVIGCTFRDYVLAAMAQRSGIRHRQAQRYWADRIADLPSAPGLPLLWRPAELTHPEFHRLRTELTPTAWQAVRDWSAAAGLTPSAAICAAFCEVLAQWSDSPRFTLNVTTFNRLPLHPDVDALVGDFTATTLLAVDGTGESSFPARATRLQDQLWKDLEHRTVTGVEVLRMLRGGDPRRRDDAVMPVVFTSTLLSDGVLPSSQVPAWRARTVYSVSQTPQVLLDHQVGEQAGKLVCTWDFVAAAFPPGLVESMFEAFETVLANLAAAAVETGGDPA
ncbi:non-ribosomal peptide synthetase [Streptomyces pinistramenti]|uniref:non-ribosomal peptide synthetase n=1 Tax=Streptomyces pinistramenti TaxID=2884812 RepID=UPI001D06BA71|nr:non-ribosomal peptide synthetase [Streptomyces pinistramenti]MCB5909703.1 amino acid adenylation domain-containing protein [Streptomyces pinistramenti]